ncbi:peptide ABC transporter periplasmic peptide-binding protein [Deinococcus phoenicis]|uniref:Peptide ABC transporter periplasmic peptide-binding protein n=1 Tax=Deinococcus phoenicis TaxID=1476583 RepID=A0A016QQF5_9DEIO|nr:ABC transporter substrate-binding protein [Deinococcus phoenicis]EYB68221.1 peptide ABC transporter periplasmic peptide-binding protein [Deinococcus phoenicis]
MKKALFVAMAMTLGSSLAAPFVYPASWTTNKPSEVQTGGTLRTVNLQDFKTLNPFVSSESPNLPDSLTAGSFLTQDPVTDEFIPYMAEKYTQSADKRTFTFTIRKGMKWSDGKPITADDWITSYTIHSDKNVGSNIYDYMSINNQPIKVTKVDADTVRVVFPKADVTALEWVSGILYPEPTHVFMPVYKSKGADGIKNMWTISTDPKDIVTSGSFMLDRYQRGERAILKKNPYFGEWNKDSAGKPLPYLDGVQINIVADANAQLTQFLAGNIDVYSPGDRDKLAQVKAAMDAKKINGVLIPNASARASSDFVVFNLDDSATYKTKLFSNPKFRQAFSMIVNRDAMVDLTLGGLGAPTYTGVYPVYKDWVASGVDKYKFNPAGAIKLLNELGFTKKGPDGVLVDKNGNKLEFTLITNAENTRRQGFAKIIQDEAKKIGMKVNTSFIAFNQMTTMLDAKDNFGRRNFDAILIGLTGGGKVFPVSGPSVIECSGLGEGGNLHMFNQSNKCRFPFETQTINLYWKGRAEFNLAARKAIANQMQKIEAEQQPYVQLAAQTVHFAWTARTQGELPRAAVNSLNASTLYGPRILDLTWIKR